MKTRAFLVLTACTSNFTLLKLTLKYQQASSEYTADKVTAKQVKYETWLCARNAHVNLKRICVIFFLG